MYIVQANQNDCYICNFYNMSFRYLLIVKFAQIKTHLQIQCNIGKVMLIKIIVIIHILSS